MNETFFDTARLTMSESIDLTVQSLKAYGSNHDHWCVAYSGGKDSSLLVTLVAHLIRHRKIDPPKSLSVMYADTRMELPPLHLSACGVLAELRSRGIETHCVLPPMDDRFFVYMFGRGVPPPSNTFRWCTAQIKIEPMINGLRELKRERGGSFLMLTGVRIGESAARDARISLSCGKNGAECGQGWFQEATPSAVADTLAPVLHWRVCHVWKWLRDYAPSFGFPTQAVADAYGGDEAEEVNARTGCVGCNLASRDVALESVVKVPRWSYLSPLLELRSLYAELKRPHNRLRKDGNERRKDGLLVSNPMRLGPLTFAARKMGLARVLDIQDRVNRNRPNDDSQYLLIDAYEKARILELIEQETWPNGWSGTEPTGDVILDETLPNGFVQKDFFATHSRGS